MPARLHFQVHAGPNRVPGFRGVGGQNQPHLGVGGVGGEGCKAKQQAGQNGSNASHTD
ncbi:MAG: hypothetical protein ABSF60_09275 [Verrucomicrobiota bacterium]